jgi:hypothetical protein
VECSIFEAASECEFTESSSGNISGNGLEYPFEFSSGLLVIHVRSSLPEDGLIGIDWEETRKPFSNGGGERAFHRE